jgi:hypothetical protein
MTGGESTPLDAIDHALSIASRCEQFSRADALRVLGDVDAALHLGPPDPTIDQIVTDAADACSGQLVIDRGLLVNQLLDIRLALSGGSVQ